MKVILLQDVARIGKRHSIVEVPDGYALNQLIPKRMAAPATPENVARVKKQTETKAAAQSADAAVFGEAIAALKGVTLTIAAEMNDKQHLFRAISVDEVKQAAVAHGVSLEKATIHFDTPIKEGGEHTVTVNHGSQSATVTINVVSK